MKILRNPHQQFKSKRAKVARKPKRRKSTNQEVSNTNSSSQVSFTGNQTITMTRGSSMTIITISIGIQLPTDMARNSSFTSLLLRNTGSNNITSQTTCSISRANLSTKWITIVTPWNPTSLRRSSPSSLATSSFQAVSALFPRDWSLTLTTFTKETL